MYGVHVRQISMSDPIVAHTVIRMTLAYFRANDTFKEKTLNVNIQETITVTATLSCTVIQIGIVLQGR